MWAELTVLAWVLCHILSIEDSITNVIIFCYFLYFRGWFMIKELQLRVEPQFAYNEQVLKETVSRQCGLDVRTITAVRTLKKSIDARQRTIFVNLTLRVFVNEQPQRMNSPA